MSNSVVEKTRLSELSRLLGLFWHPVQSFRDIVANPRYVVPLVLATLCSLAFTVAVSQRVGWEDLVRGKLTRSQKFQSLSSDEVEATIAATVPRVRAVAYTYAALGSGIQALIVSGVLYVVFVAWMFSFRKMVAIVMYSLVPQMVSALLSIVLVLLKRPDEIDPDKLQVLSAGTYVDPASVSAWVMSLFGSVDIFDMLMVLLLATGVWVGARGKPFSRCLILVVVPWLAWIAIRALLAGTQVFGMTEA